MRVKRLLVGLLAASWLAGIAVPVSAAVPELPHAFYGNLTVEGAPAKVGTRVEARGTGVLTGIAGNPLTTTLQGAYGGPGSFDPKLVVQGAIAQGATVSFFVDGKPATQTATWVSGQISRLDLTVVKDAAPPPGGGGGGGVAPGGGAPPAGGGTGSTTVALTGLTGTASALDNRGKTQNAAKLKTADSKVDINIAAGTEMTDKAGQAISTLSAAPLATPPVPPLGGSVVLAYEFGPAGARFNPPIIMTLSFNPATLPPGTTVDRLFVAWWDASAGKWEKLGSTVDPVNNTIMAPVSHFTEFAIIFEPVVLPSTPVVVTAPVPVPAPEPSPVPAPKPGVTSEPAQELAPSVTPAAPSPPLPSPEALKPANNLALVAGIVGVAVLVIGTAILLLRRKQRQG
ncbi:MAG: hypothetical protein HYX84_01040 [Chloroflexi bacterium]|nr:hypothetical protein [Chloroflexota bacterium]